MASLFKKPNGVYYLSFYSAERRPTRKQVSLKTRTRRTAETLQRRLEDAWTLGEYDPWVSDLPDPDGPQRRSLALVGDAKAAFLASRAHMSPMTCDKYETVLGGLVRFLGPDHPTAAVTTAHVSVYLRATKTRPVSKRSYAGAMSAFFNWLVREGARTDNPVAGVVLERVPQKHPRYLSVADVEAVCRAIRGGRRARPHGRRVGAVAAPHRAG